MDVTPLINTNGYFGSFNIPYFTEYAATLGYTYLQEKYDAELGDNWGNTTSHLQIRYGILCSNRSLLCSFSHGCLLLLCISILPLFVGSYEYKYDTYYRHLMFEREQASINT